MDGEFAEHEEEGEGEERVGGDGEVVDEAGEGDEGADGDGRAYERFGVGGFAQVCEADEEDGQAGGEEEEADPVELFEFVPS